MGITDIIIIIIFFYYYYYYYYYFLDNFNALGSKGSRGLKAKQKKMIKLLG